MIKLKSIFNETTYIGPEMHKYLTVCLSAMIFFSLKLEAASIQIMGKSSEILPTELNDKGLIVGKKSFFDTRKSGGHWGQNDRGEPMWFDDYETTQKDVLAYWDYEKNKEAVMEKNGKILLNNQNIMILEYYLTDKVLSNLNGSEHEKMPQKSFWLFFPDGKKKELTNTSPELSLCTFDEIGNITFKNEKDDSFLGRHMEEDQNHPIAPLADCKSPFTGDESLPSSSIKELETEVNIDYYKNLPIPNFYIGNEAYETIMSYHNYFGDRTKLKTGNNGWKLLKILKKNNNQQIIAEMKYTSFEWEGWVGGDGWGKESGTYTVFIDMNKNVE